MSRTNNAGKRGRLNVVDTLLTTLVVLLGCTPAVVAQGYTLDQGVKPIPLHYQAGPGQSGRQVGELRYHAKLLNGEPQDDGDYVFSFSGQKEARLEVSVTVDINRPNGRKNKDLRVIFPREAFGAMGRKAWEVDAGSGRPYGTTLAHGESKTFYFRYRRNGVVSFNLPFVVADRSAPREDWRLPPAGTPQNHLLTRQIKAAGLLSDEDRLWRAGKDDFAGVATYLRAYPRGKYEDDGNRLFMTWLEGDFQHLVVDSESLDAVRKFISRYVPFEDFDVVHQRLEAARARLRGARPAAATAVVPNRPRRRTRSRRPTTPPVAIAEVATGEPAARIVSDDGGIQTIKLYNFTRPAYYDIYGGLLDIDDSAMRSDGILRIRQIKQGSVDFLVVERGDEERYATVQLHNLMEAELAFDQVLNRYDLSIEGGIKPYQLYLQPLAGQRYDWGMDRIESSSVSIPLYDLQQAGLRGQYLVQITSAGSKRAVTLRGEVLDVPEPSGNYTWVYPLLVAIGIGLFALALLFLLNRIGRRRKFMRDRQRVRV